MSWDSWAGFEQRGDVEGVEAARDAGEGVAEAIQGLGLAARGAGAAEVAAEGLARAVEWFEGGRGGGLVRDHALGLGDEAGVDVVDLQEAVVDVAGGGRRGDRGDGVADAADVGLDALQRGSADGGALCIPAEDGVGADEHVLARGLDVVDALEIGTDLGPLGVLAAAAARGEEGRGDERGREEGTRAGRGARRGGRGQRGGRATAGCSRRVTT